MATGKGRKKYTYKEHLGRRINKDLIFTDNQSEQEMGSEEGIIKHELSLFT